MSSGLPGQKCYDVFSTDSAEAEKMGIGFMPPDVSEKYTEPESSSDIPPRIQQLIDEEQSRLFSPPERDNLLYASHRGDNPFNNSHENSINRTTPFGFMKFF